MSSSVRSTLLIVLVVVCAASLLWVFSARRNGRVIMADGRTTDIHKMSPEALNHEVRSELPIGSPLPTVEEYLRRRGIEFSFESSTKTLYATARKLKGSTMVSSKSLSLQLYFDDGEKLKSLETKVTYTGP